MQDLPFYFKCFLSIDYSVRRLLLLKIVLHSLFADAIDGLRPNLANADPFWWISGWSICLKKPYFHSGRNNFKSEVITWVFIGPAYQGFFVAKLRILKHRGIVRHTDVISENKRWKCQLMIPLQTILAKKPRQRDETVFKLCHFYCLSICLILTVFRFVGAKLHFRFNNLSVFWHAFLLNKLCQIFERYLTKCVLFLTYILSGIPHKYESVAFRQRVRAQNTI